jgi:hypothetical protein
MTLLGAGLYTLASLWVAVATAHPLDLGYLEATFDEAATPVTIEINHKLAETLSGNDSAQLFRLTLGESVLTRQSRACAWEFHSAEKTLTDVRLQGVAKCPVKEGTIDWSFPFLRSPKIPETFQLLIKVVGNGKDHVYTVDPKTTELHFSVETTTRFIRFVVMGMAHIGATFDQWYTAGRFHFPDGIDHILFLLALLIGGGRFVDLLKTATGFTVGHSLTLALATSGLVQLPSRIVETAIAASIAFVAAESLFVKTPRHRWKLATFFGLVHGFGFAAALTELHLSPVSLGKALVGFNVGVELGQILLLLSLFPLLRLLTYRPRIERIAVPTGALLLFGIGIYWCVERAFAR